jgi:hypothetical protein
LEALGAGALEALDAATLGGLGAAVLGALDAAALRWSMTETWQIAEDKGVEVKTYRESKMIMQETAY